MADWSALPEELLYMISVLLLTSPIGIVRFRSVCTTWRAAAAQPRPDPSSGNLVVPVPPGFTNSPYRKFLYLAKSTIYALQSPFDDNNNNNNNNPSWIIRFGLPLISHSDPIYLDHPLMRSGIERLPPTFPKPFSFLNIRVRELGEEYTVFDIGKVAVLKEMDSAFVMLLANEHAYVLSKSAGDEKWSFMEVFKRRDNAAFSILLAKEHSEFGNEEWRPIKDFDDVVVMGGKFYVVDNQGRLVRVNHVDLTVEIVVASPIDDGRGNKFLVVCQGNLLLVDLQHCYEEDDRSFEDVRSYCFEKYGFCYDEVGSSCYLSGSEKLEVYKLDENSGKWMEVNDLGDMVLFLGDKYSFSASAKDVFGESSTACCKGNCIIYTHKELYWCRVFDLGTRSVEDLDSLPDYSKMFWPPPDWAYSAASN